MANENENQGAALFTPKDGLALLDIIKDQQKMIDNLAKSTNLISDNLQSQITNLQRQITLLATMHVAEPKNVIDAEEGLKKLHEEALADPFKDVEEGTL